MTDMRSAISIVIPSLNGRLIAQTIQSVLAQETADQLLEIIVVGLDDDHLIPKHERVRYVSTSQPVSAARARNIGYREARGTVVCFLDADCLAMPGWLSMLVGCLVQGYGAVGGGVAFDEGNYWSTCDNVMALAPFLTSMRAGPRRYLASLNLAVPHRLLDALGGFDENFPGAAGEDVDLSVRLRRIGYELYFEPRAAVRHCHERTDARSTWRHLFRFGEVWFPLSIRSEDMLGPARRARLAQKASWLWLVGAPMAALIESVVILARTSGLRRYWYITPGLAWGRLAWYVGGIRSMRQSSRG
jgi:glycosyltransferase involved in cell wall biosynthesis